MKTVGKISSIFAITLTGAVIFSNVSPSISREVSVYQVPTQTEALASGLLNFHKSFSKQSYRIRQLTGALLWAGMLHAQGPIPLLPTQSIVFHQDVTDGRLKIHQKLNEFLSRLLNDKTLSADELAAVIKFQRVTQENLDFGIRKTGSAVAAIQTQCVIQANPSGANPLTLKQSIIVDEESLHRVLDLSDSNPVYRLALTIMILKEGALLVDMTAHPQFYINSIVYESKFNSLSGTNDHSTEMGQAAEYFVVAQIEGEQIGYKMVMNYLREKLVTENRLALLSSSLAIDPWTRSLFMRLWLINNQLLHSSINSSDSELTDLVIRENIFSVEIWLGWHTAALQVLGDYGANLQDLTTDPTLKFLKINKKISVYLDRLLKDRDFLNKDPIDITVPASPSTSDQPGIATPDGFQMNKLPPNSLNSDSEKQPRTTVQNLQGHSESLEELKLYSGKNLETDRRTLRLLLTKFQMTEDKLMLGVRANERKKQITIYRTTTVSIQTFLSHRNGLDALVDLFVSSVGDAEEGHLMSPSFRDVPILLGFLLQNPDSALASYGPELTDVLLRIAKIGIHREAMSGDGHDNLMSRQIISFLIRQKVDGIRAVIEDEIDRLSHIRNLDGWASNRLKELKVISKNLRSLKKEEILVTQLPRAA